MPKFSKWFLFFRCSNQNPVYIWYVSGYISQRFYIFCLKYVLVCRMFLPDGTTARGGPWPPLQCAFRPLDSLLCLSIHLNPSSSSPWTRHPATSFLAFLFVVLHTAFRTTSFLELRCLAFFLYDLATVFFGI